MKIYSFPHGGLDFEDPTAPDKNSAENAFLPVISVIPYGNNHVRAVPLVSVGDHVKEGMLIGKAVEKSAVNVHATVPGRVIRKVQWNDCDNLENEAFVIKMEGAFEKLGKKEEEFSWIGINGYDLQKIISDFGIVEMEKFGYPLSSMIHSYRKLDKKFTLVVRCVFDDPWLAADYVLCKDRLKAVVEGSMITAHACIKINRIIFAVSYKQKELGQKMLDEASGYDIASSLVLTGSRYPQRNGRELELALRIYEKKEELDLGSFLILGPAVFAAVYDAVKYKKPVLDRYVAVGGSAVKNPQVIKTRIGTRIGDLIEQCGGFINKPYKITNGSVLSGRKVMYLDEPVTKTCYAIAAMTKKQASPPKQRNCINCGGCREVCPVGLDPQYIYKELSSIETADTNTISGIKTPLVSKLTAESMKSSGCHGCGCCKIVCPSALPLAEAIYSNNQGASFD
jgi:electron transport complex protein RnfC